MTATIDLDDTLGLEGEDSSGTPVFDTRLAAAVSAVLVAALIAMPFLRQDLAATTMTRIIIVVMLLLSFVDIVTLRVPNVLVLPATAFVLAGTAIVEPGLVGEAALGGVTGLGIMFVLALIGRGSMGMGDVKFACLSGCALGWKGAIGSLLLGFAAGGIVALLVLLLRLRDRKDSLPLTPFLAAGAITWGVLAGFVLS